MPSFQVGFVGSNPTWGSSPRGEVDITRPCEGRVSGSSPDGDTNPYSSAVGHCGRGRRSGVRVLLRILASVAQLHRASGFEPEGRRLESCQGYQKGWPSGLRRQFAKLLTDNTVRGFESLILRQPDIGCQASCKRDGAGSNPASGPIPHCVMVARVAVNHLV